LDSAAARVTLPRLLFRDGLACLSVEPDAMTSHTYNNRDLGRFIAEGMSCDQLKISNFTHHHHLHVGMWDTSVIVHQKLDAIFNTGARGG
jgi:hypothetical protein